MTKEDRLADRIGEYFERLAAGEALTPEDFAEQHPEFGAALRDALADQVALHMAFGSLADESHAAATAMPERVGDYRLLREVGRGGMGVVYEAEQISLRRRVALKVLTVGIGQSPFAVRRFEREARAAARLHHTNIVPIYDMGHFAGQWYYAMELVEGRSLGELVGDLQQDVRATGSESLARLTPEGEALQTGGPVQPYYARLAHVFAGVAEALHLAHHEGVIHRDIKPNNLLLDKDGVLKIVDFGLAFQDRDGAPGLTKTGDILGTPAYMSPEQASVQSTQIDHRTDVYSLGATLYEVLTLQPPFKADSLPEYFTAISSQDPTLPRRRNPRIPRDLETIVCKAMEKDRDRRYPDAGELAEDLRRFAEGRMIAANRIGPLGRSWRKVQRHRVRSTLTAAVILLATLGVFLGLRMAREAGSRAELEYERVMARAYAEFAHLPERIASHEYEELFGDPGANVRLLLDRAHELAPGEPDPPWLRGLLPGAPLDAAVADLDRAKARGLPDGAWRVSTAVLRARESHDPDARRAPAPAAEPSARGPREAYAAAELALLRGDHRAARRLLEDAVGSLDPEDGLRAVAIRRRGRLRMQTRDYAGALADFQALTGLAKDDYVLEVAIAALWRRMGRSEEAGARFKAILARAVRSGDTTACWILCNSLQASNFDDWLTEASQACAAAHPNVPSLVRMQVVALFQSDRGVEALALAEDLATRFPEDAQAMTALGQALFHVKRDQDALDALKRARAVAPTRHRAHEAMATVLSRLGRFADARAAADEAIRLDPHCQIARVVKADVLAAGGDGSGALASLDEAIRTFPDSARLHARRAHALLVARRWGAALEATGRVLALDPDHAMALGNRAFALLNLDRPADALEAARRAAELAPRHLAVRNALVTSLDRLGRYGEALDAVRAAIDAGQQEAYFYFRAGQLLCRLRRPAEAVDSFREALGRSPDSASIALRLASTLSTLGRREQAAAVLEELRRRHPTLAAGHRMWARVTADQGRTDEAIEAAEKAVALARDADNLSGLATVLVAADRLDRARALVAEALALEPGHMDALGTRARLELATGDAAAAVKTLTPLLARGERSGALWDRYGAALRASGRPEEALTAFERAEASGRVYGKRAPEVVHALNALERWKDSEAYARAQLAKAPTAELWRVLAWTLRLAGRAEDAVEASAHAFELSAKKPLVVLDHAMHLHAVRREAEAEETLQLAEKLAKKPQDQIRLASIRSTVCVDAGRIDEALAVLEAAEREHPTAADLPYMRGCIHRRNRKDLKKALACYDLALARDPRHLEATVEKGGVLMDWPRMEDAVAHHAKARAWASFDPRVVFNHLLSVLLAGRPAEALEGARAAMAERPTDADLVYVEAGALRALGRPEEALRAYAHVLELDPVHLGALNDRPIILREQGRAGEALADLDRALKHIQDESGDRLLSRGDSRLHGKLLGNKAELLLSLNRPKEARAAAQEAVDLDNGAAIENPAAHVTLGCALARLGRVDDALKVLERACGLSREPAFAYYHRGMLLWQLGRRPEALAAMAEAAKRQATLHGIHVNYAGKLLDVGRVEEARALLEACLPAEEATHTLRAAAWNLLGVVRMRSAQFDTALVALGRAVELDPKNPFPHRNRAMVLGRLGRPAEAVAAFKAAMDCGDRSGETLEKLGFALYQARRYEEAGAALDEARERGVKTDALLALRARVMLFLHQEEKALEAAEEAVELYPKSVDSLMTLGAARGALGRHESAVVAYRMVQEIRPDYAGAWSFAGRALTRLGKFAEAVSSFERAVSLEESNPVNHNELAWMLLTCGDKRLRDESRALTHARRAVKLAPASPHCLGTLGVALYRADAFAEAAKALAKAAEAQTDAGAGTIDRLVLAMAQHRLGRIADAKATYKKAVAALESSEADPPEATRAFHTEAAGLLGLER